MHYIWRPNSGNEQYYTRAAIQNVKALAGLKLLAGQSLLGRLPELRLEILSQFPPADYFSAGPLFIVSARLKRLFEENGAVAEYFPVTIIRAATSVREHSFFFANLLERIDCLDMVRSVYTIDGEFVDKITEMVICDEKVGRSPVFRLANVYDVVVVVSQTLRDALVTARITGVVFQEPKDWIW